MTAKQRTDWVRFSVAMREIGKSTLSASEVLLKMAASLRDLAGRRWSVRPPSIAERFGPRNTSADGSWQSDVCAAWVHESCPASTECDCTCHGGTVR